MFATRSGTSKTRLRRLHARKLQPMWMGMYSDLS